MNIRIAVMDDEKTFCSALSEKLLAWGKETKNLIDISAFTTSWDLLEAWSKGQDFDAVFLDINMGEDSVSGLEVSHQLRNRRYEAPIVFLTSLTRFMQEGYQVEAFRYLLKPLNDGDFEECMDRLSLKIQSRGNKFLFLKLGVGKYIRIPFEEILYVEGAGNYVDITTKNGVYHYRITLNELLKILPPQFVRCHRCIIVNLENVDGIDRQGFMFGDKRQVISKKFREEAERQYMQHFG